MLLVITVNTITLAMDQYPINKKRDEIIEVIGYFFTLFFTFEFLIKLTGLGFKEYVQDKFRIFDGTLVLISMFTFGMEIFSKFNPSSSDGGGG